MNGRDRHGMVAAALSVAKLPFERGRGRHLADDHGRCRRRSAARPASGSPTSSACSTATSASGGFHMNVNVLDRATLEDAMEHPERYPQLTIRVSGYAVNFVRLTREQQLDVIDRTFHGAL